MSVLVNSSENSDRHSNFNTMFSKANHFTVNNSMFNSAGRDFNYNISTTDDGFRGLHLLYNSMAISAVHNSETSYPPAKCHEGTREAILRRLTDWITDTGRDTQLCWLYGSAGVGKSSVAQTIAERFEQEGKLAASFFFWRSDVTRNNVRRLIPTLAFQLAVSIPALRPAITSAVETNFMVLDSSLETQIQELIIRPFQNLDECEADIPLLVILDGLDECTDSRDQERVLLTIADVLQSKSIPLLFLVTSRPEPRIKKAFDKLASSYSCNRHALEDSDEDIHKYLSDRFAEINTRRVLSTNSDAEQPWPTPRQLDELVYKASGQFIFASTVVKFVDDNFSLPSERLRIVLGSADSEEQEDSLDPLIGSHEPEDTEQPFRELDRLYREILSVNPNTQLLLRILGAIVIFPEYEVPETDTIEHLLALKPGGVSAALSGMHSLLKYDPEVKIEFTHKSLTDFLLDPKRSGRFFVDRPIHHNFMARRCLKFMLDGQSRTRSKVSPTKDQEFSDEWSSAMYDDSPMAYHRHWGYHCVSAVASLDLIRDLRALDLVAYATTLCMLAATLKLKRRSPWLFIALLGFFVGKVRRVQRWLEESTNPPRELIQRYEQFSSVGFYVTTSVPRGAYRKWRTQITQFGKLLAFSAVVADMDPDSDSGLAKDSLREFTGHDENRNRLIDLKQILPMEISIEDPLSQCSNEQKSKEAQGYHTEFVDLADYHTVIAVRCLESLIDQQNSFLYAKSYWIKHLIRAVPRQDLLNLLDSYIRSGQLEDDKSEAVYKVLLEWLEQLCSLPVGVESATPRALITALCDIIHPAGL
ncbi:hypothetical protein F5880DRAFT_1600569 [Lentinula raphanica]|nr:hypothetical protein F5880DRAFT_1600569 [Lentinula raphanica]